MKMEVKVKMNYEDLVDLWSAADSGIAYWCDCLYWETAEDEDDRLYNLAHTELCKTMEEELICREDIWAKIQELGHPLILDVDMDEDGNVTPYKVTKEDLEKGVALAIKKGQWDGQDWGDVDAMVADCIVQYAVFGELVFG